MHLQHLSDAEYFALPHVNRSVIYDAWKRSPAHSRVGIQSTPAMDFGTAVHRLMLQPEEFQKSYGVLKDDWVSKSARPKTTKKWKEAEAKTPGVTLITPKEYEEYNACLQSGYEHPRASNLLSDSSAEREVTTTWTDDYTGLDLKAKYDLISEVHGWIADIKTTRDASPGSFSKSAANFGYVFQAAFYLQQVPSYDYYIIAIETAPPYLTAVYQFNPDDMQHGQRQVAEALEQYAHCVNENDWHGYPDDVQTLEMPGWWA